MYSLHDMNKIINEIKAIQTCFKCSDCNEYYNKKWCNSDIYPCYFCKNFISTKETYMSIIKDINWWYLKSGEISRKEYYNEFLDNLEKWALKKSLIPTNNDLKMITELRNVQDWTRNEPEYEY
jgi:hypothetical protein